VIAGKKGLKKSAIMSKLPSLVSLFRNLRLLTGAVALLAWFILSNHCLLDAAVSPSLEKVAQTTCCPMHASKPHSPARQKDKEEMQLCCKNLAATAVKSSHSPASFITPPLVFWFDQDHILAPGWNERPLLCLDTGPPNALSFSELVLQRSLPAHAPPFLA
jgi:hypothetical protein